MVRVLLFVIVVAILPSCVRWVPDEHELKVMAEPPAEAPLWKAIEQQRSGDWVSILNTGEQSLEWRLRGIDSATQTIDLQTFLWHDDEAGLSILCHLVEAAKRGVRVRLLIDDTFTVGHAKDIWDVDHHPNIEYRIYNPFRHRPDSMAMRQLMNLGAFSRVDHRMHNKSLIVDNRVAVIGGRNLGDEYFGLHDVSNFRDMDLLCSGEHVKELSGLFDGFWNNRWSVDEEELLSEPRVRRTAGKFDAWLEDRADLRLNETSAQRKAKWVRMASKAVSAKLEVVADLPAPQNPARVESMPNQLSKLLIKELDSAKKEIVLVTAYLIPTENLEAAIERAEKRGVKVQILTNSIRSNNHLTAHAFYRKHIERLLSHGAEVYEVRAEAKDRGLYMQRPVVSKKLGLHAKLILIDGDCCYVGSANLDPRSLRLNTEMGLVIRSAEFNRRMRELIKIDFDTRNAWHVQKDNRGKLLWIGDDQTHRKQPAASRLQSLEDWFLGLLPLEGEM